MRKLTGKRDQLARDKLEAEEECDQMRCANKKLQNAKDCLAIDKHFLEEELRNVRNEKETLANDKRQIRKEKRDLEHELENARDEKTKVSLERDRALSRLAKQLEDEKETLEAERESLREKLRNLSEAMKSSDEKCYQLTLDNERMRTERDLLAEQKSGLEKTCDLLRGDREEVQRQYSSALEARKENNNASQSNKPNESLEEECEQLREELEKMAGLKRKQLELSDKLQVTAKELDDATKERDKHAQICLATTSERDQLKLDNEKSNALLKSTQQELADLKAKKTATELEIAECQGRNEHLRNELESLRAMELDRLNECNKLKQETDDIGTSVAEEKSKLEKQCADQIESMREKHAETIMRMQAEFDKEKVIRWCHR